MRVAFFTLGCKVNQYETQNMMQLFASQQFDIIEPDETADIYIVNSCTVTSSGDKKTRQAIRKFKRNNPTAVVALTGCFPQAFPDVASEIPEADVITGATNRSHIVDYVKRFMNTGEKIIEITQHQRDEKFETMEVSSFHDKTRAFIKIQDGCERYCSYCIIPFARGFVRSKSLDDLKIELFNLVAGGYKEVVLVGINLSTYGKDFGGKLIDAVTIACTTEGIERVRLGSIEPDLFTDEDILALSSYKQFCPQFHLSLQSGCDSTLDRMNRHYDTAFYRDLVERIRKIFKNSAITTDLMVGFAGETDQEFEDTCEFIKEIGFSKVHIFPYSKRDGTRAAKFPDQISQQLKGIRSKIATEITDETRRAFLASQVGLIEEVLFEGGVHKEGYEGYTKNYTPVRVQSTDEIRGKICMVEIIKAEQDFCIGRICN